MFPIRDHHPSLRTPVVTYALIGANILVWLYQLSLGEDGQAMRQFMLNYALFPAAISAGEGYTGLFSHMFLHAGFMHLAGNMLFLWIFGDNLEDQMGHGGFLLFYLAAGLAAAVAQIVAAPSSAVPMVGASGAIAGVMGGYLLMFPRARIDILLIFIVFFRVFTLPAYTMLGIWFAFQIFGGLGSSGADGGVAYWAHGGGFVAGLFLTLPLWARRGAKRYWQQTEGHPPHPEIDYSPSNIPIIRRRRK
ncbi:MAG: rhomboid family intramembrane serine protease [Paracoccaceae bacterium]